MRRSLPFLAAAQVLCAQAPAPVDYPALEAIERTFMSAAEKAAKNGAKDLRSPEIDAIRKEVAGRIDRATGEEKEALLILLLRIAGAFDPEYDSIPGRVAKEVPPSSPAWKLAVEIAPWVDRIKGLQGTGYAQALAEQGIPEVRRRILAAKVNQSLGETEDLSAAQAANGLLQRQFPGSKEAGEAQSLILGAQRTAVGEAAPAFSVPSLADPKIAITGANFKGKYLLMDFWGTWCTWCVKELPTTHRLYAQFKPRGLEILSLATDSKPEVVTRFRTKPGMPMPWAHAFLGQDREHRHPVLTDYGILGFPSLFLISPDGRILAKGKDLREEKLAATLEKFLGTPVK